MDVQRQMLDELMGKDRNLSTYEKNNRREHYDDPDVRFWKILIYI